MTSLVTATFNVFYNGKTDPIPEIVNLFPMDQISGHYSLYAKKEGSEWRLVDLSLLSTHPETAEAPKSIQSKTKTQTEPLASTQGVKAVKQTTPTPPSKPVAHLPAAPQVPVPPRRPVSTSAPESKRRSTAHASPAASLPSKVPAPLPPAAPIRTSPARGAQQSLPNPAESNQSALKLAEPSNDLNPPIMNGINPNDDIYGCEIPF